MRFEPRTAKMITDLAHQLTDHDDRLRAIERTPQLPHSSISGSLPVLDSDGQLMQIIGQQPDGTFTSASVDGPVPPVPSGLEFESVPGGVVVTWDGSTVSGVVPADFDRVEVSTGGRVWEIKAREGGSVSVVLGAGDHVLTARMVSQSGQRSGETDPVTVSVAAFVDDPSIAEALADARADLSELADRLAAAPSILRGTVDPVDAAPDGTVYFRVDDTGAVVGQFQRVGGVWQVMPVRSEVIANLDVGKLVAGDVAVSEAVIERLWVDGLAANSATLARALVAVRNLVPGMDRIKEEIPAPFDVPGFGRDTDQSWIWVQEGAVPGNVVTSDAPGAMLHLEAGIEYIFSLEDRGPADSSYYVQITNPDGTNPAGVTVDGSGTTYLLSDVRTASGWAWVGRSARFTVPETGDYRLRFYPHHTVGSVVTGAYQWWRDIAVRDPRDGSIIAENFVAAAELKADTLWANRTWQREAYFSDTLGGFEARVDGTGIRVWEKAEDATHDPVPVVTLGAGGENTFSTYADGVFLAGIGADGSITGTSVSSEEDITVGGKDLLGDLTEYEIPGQDNSSILSPLPRGVITRGLRNMGGMTYTAPSHVGFLEVSFEATRTRAYRLAIDPYSMSNNKDYIQRIMITYDGRSPHWEDWDQSFVSRIRNGIGGGGTFYIDPPQDGLARVLVGVYSSTAGMAFDSGSLSVVRMWVEDIGSKVPDTGIDRGASLTPVSGGGSSSTPNPKPVKKSHTSAWRPSWMRSFMNGGSSQQVYGKGSTLLKQGYDRYWAAGGIQTSLFGGFSSNAVAGEKTKTISQALSGASIDSGSIELKADYIPGGGSAVARLHWHTNSSAPGSYTSTSGHIGDYTFKQGASRRIALPPAVLNAIKAGTFGGFGFTPRGSSSNSYNMGISWSARPTLRLSYQR